MIISVRHSKKYREKELNLSALVLTKYRNHLYISTPFIFFSSLGLATYFVLFFVETEQKEEDSEYLAELCSDLADRYKEEQLDAYLLYLYVFNLIGFLEQSNRSYLLNVCGEKTT